MPRVREELDSLLRENQLLRTRVVELERAASRFGSESTASAPSTTLSEREALLIEAERIMHAGSWVWDVATNAVFWSDELFRILGYDADADVPSVEAFFARIDAEDLPRVQVQSQTLVTTGISEHSECRIRWRDGTVRHVSMSGAPLFDERGVLRRIVGTVVDITERRRAAAATDRALMLLAEAQRIAEVGSWVLDVPTGQLEWSRQMRHILGLPEGVVATTGRFLEAVHPDDRQRLASIHEAALAGGSGAGEARLVHADGSVRHVYVVSTALYDDRGRIAELRGTLLDVTRRVRLEEQLLGARKLEALGRLSGGIAHDFNNLLTVMLGNLDLLKAAVDPDARVFVQQIEHAAEVAAQLTRQLLAFARRAPLAPEVLVLGEALPEALAVTRRLLPSRIDLQCAVLDATSSARLDRAQLQQILMNLVLNARDAISGEGTIVVSTHHQVVEESSARDPDLSPGSYVVLSVRDDGAGMDSATRARVFEPFFTTKEAGPGAGLGLAVVFGAVAQHGGVISVDSEPGRGTTFRIHFRTVASESRSTTPGNAALVQRERKRRVLLVEDQANVAWVMTHVLEGAGYEVHRAARPAEAVAIWRKREGRFDLLITDVMMPEMRGPQLVAELARHAPVRRTLFITGYGPELFGEDSERREHAVLEKPFNNETLLAAVAAVLATDPAPTDEGPTPPRAIEGRA